MARKKLGSMIKSFVWILLLPSFLSCAGHETRPQMQPAYGTASAQITQTFASQTMAPGETWKVYLKATDPNAQMKYIFCIIEQPGVGYYPESIIPVHEANRKAFNGYIYLSTFQGRKGGSLLNFVNLTLNVSIEDTAGHFSQPIKFPLSINATSKQEPPPPGIFDEHNDLGPIMISLRPTMLR